MTQTTPTEIATGPSPLSFRQVALRAAAVGALAYAGTKAQRASMTYFTSQIIAMIKTNPRDYAITDRLESMRKTSRAETFVRTWLRALDSTVIQPPIENEAQRNQVRKVVCRFVHGHPKLLRESIELGLCDVAMWPNMNLRPLSWWDTLFGGGRDDHTDTLL